MLISRLSPLRTAVLCPVSLPFMAEKDATARLRRAVKGWFFLACMTLRSCSYELPMPQRIIFSS